MPRWVAIVLAPVVACVACDDGTPAGVGTGAESRAASTSVAVPEDAAPAPPTAAPTTAPDVVPEGFGTISARAVAADGEICDLCLWLADDVATRGRGLMGVTSLGGLDGMAFRYDAPHSTSFTMRNTMMPLSIAFFGPDRSYLGAFDMEPCLVEACPSYPTPTGFVVALEVPRGGLAELGLDAGSTLELGREGCGEG